MSIPEEWLPGLSQPDVQAFIRENEGTDPYSLSLKHRAIGGVDFKIIARQLAAREKAKSKLPEWYDTPGIVFPPPENLAQASSEATARYKAGLISGDHLVDLTGGTGIDTFYLSYNFNHTVYVDPFAPLAEMARHNFMKLKRPIEVIITDAGSYLADHQPASHYYIDPSRRDSEQKRLYDIHDCAPDVTQLLQYIPDHSRLLIKLSPMLDIQQTLRELGNNVDEVHVVAVQNEVKELLFLYARSSNNPKIHAINIRKNGSYQQFDFTPEEEYKALVTFDNCENYLYEANAALRKSGAFKLVAQHYGLKKLGLHTHLYTSKEIRPDFPGRIFKVDWCLPYQPRGLRKTLGIAKANIQTRNFPENVNEIRKRTRFSVGGDRYLFFYRDHKDNLMVAGGPKAE